ncbi:hypothetical protein N7450_005688 [Penicillium hetheringtonii]|uniref:Uncharacterized protein n=1 Tax=Penicillium hetheringtonii TaxID=911720 RepID=A0AAD6DKF6_9EURO|nr:hypothetical protein N7450_005688 [Penicillium hetheringtonii]
MPSNNTPEQRSQTGGSTQNNGPTSPTTNSPTKPSGSPRPGNQDLYGIGAWAGQRQRDDAEKQKNTAYQGMSYYELRHF